MTDNNSLERRIESDDYGPDSPCSQCGEILDKYCPEWTEYCMRHNDRRSSPMVLELEGLVKEWERDAKQLEKKFAAGLLKYKARELREVIGKYD